MPYHLIYGAAALVGKGVLAAGHALGHAVAAHNATQVAGAKLATHAAVTHPVEAGLGIAAGLSLPILTVAYLDHKKAMELLPESPNVVTAKTVKVSIAGKLARGEFTTITGPFDARSDVIALGHYDTDRQEMVSQRLVKANRVEPRLANAYGQGNVVVLK